MAKLLLVRKVDTNCDYTTGVLYIAKNNPAATMVTPHVGVWIETIVL